MRFKIQIQNSIFWIIIHLFYFLFPRKKRVVLIIYVIQSNKRTFKERIRNFSSQLVSFLTFRHSRDRWRRRRQHSRRSSLSWSRRRHPKLLQRLTLTTQSAGLQVGSSTPPITFQLPITPLGPRLKLSTSATSWVSSISSPPLDYVHVSFPMVDYSLKSPLRRCHNHLLAI